MGKEDWFSLTSTVWGMGMCNFLQDKSEAETEQFSMTF